MPVRPREFDLASLPAPVSRRRPAVAPVAKPKPQAGAAPSAVSNGGRVPPPAVAPVPLPTPPPAPAVQIPGYALFSIKAIFWSTLLGSPLAGSILVGKNFSRLGRGNATFWSILAGLLATIAHLVTCFKSWAAGLVVGAVFLVAMVLIARTLLGTEVKEHQNRGGRLASGWGAFGIALLCFVGILAGIAVFAN